MTEEPKTIKDQQDLPLVYDERCAKSIMAYPDVMANAREWAWSDKPCLGTVTVTEHGLRRLLRLASQMWPIVMHLRMLTCVKDASPELLETYACRFTPEQLAEISGESASIFCEGNLVMSRLFVHDGKVFAHKDEEVDAAGIPPWAQSAALSTKENHERA